MQLHYVALRLQQLHGISLLWNQVIIVITFSFYKNQALKWLALKTYIFIRFPLIKLASGVRFAMP